MSKPDVVLPEGVERKLQLDCTCTLPNGRCVNVQESTRRAIAAAIKRAIATEHRNCCHGCLRDGTTCGFSNHLFEEADALENGDADGA